MNESISHVQNLKEHSDRTLDLAYQLASHVIETSLSGSAIPSADQAMSWCTRIITAMHPKVVEHRRTDELTLSIPDGPEFNSG